MFILVYLALYIFIGLTEALPNDYYHQNASRNRKTEFDPACSGDQSCVPLNACPCAVQGRLLRRIHCGESEGDVLICCPSVPFSKPSNGRQGQPAETLALTADIHSIGKDFPQNKHLDNVTAMAPTHTYAMKELRVFARENETTNNDADERSSARFVRATNNTSKVKSTPKPITITTTVSPSQKACQKYINTSKIQRYRSVVLKVFGGLTAQHNEFPFIVAVGYVPMESNNTAKLTWGCGGSIISERYVLTAAHCITDAQEDGLRPTVVRAGVTYLAEGGRANGDYDVENVQRHPQHNRSERHHDLALLRTNRAITFSSAVRPICLPSPSTTAATRNLAAPAKFTAAGWGATSVDGDEKSNYLKKANLQEVPLQECKNLFAAKGNIPKELDENVLCAVHPERKADTCLGDSGGPLVARSATGVVTLVAVISFGSLPCGGQRPSVYARTALELKWIESVAWPQ